MDSIIEEKRSLHEERDRIELAVVEEILSKKSNHREKLDSEHRQKKLLDRYMKCSKKLFSLYEQQMYKPQQLFSEPLDHFYAELRKIKDFYSDEQANEIEEQIPAIPKLEKQIEFTDEEGYGRYLDLNKCHEDFLQVIKKRETKPNYLTFLENFDKFTELPREEKLSSVYKNYLSSMLDYFRDYCSRATPLFDYQHLEKKVLEEFAKNWDKKIIPGWFTESDRAVTNLIPMIDLESYKSCEELLDMGLDCLKKELQARGLKCGGTLEERAKRLWSVRGKSPGEIDVALKAAPIVVRKGRKKISIEPYHIASMEALLVIYAEQLNEYRIATIENVQRKQARTAEERNESDDDLSDIDDDANDPNDVVYNPKNLPLGWDGKPIPYWLYKLHGLNLTFTCEICGNAIYKGPKTFQRHFSESRHAHGMTRLGIPNTAHFANITKIQDAISLWQKLKDEKSQNKFQPAIEEEFEDSQGNVVSRKTYEDLKRQGLL